MNFFDVFKGEKGLTDQGIAEYVEEFMRTGEFISSFSPEMKCGIAEFVAITQISQKQRNIGTIGKWDYPGADAATS